MARNGTPSATRILAQIAKHDGVTSIGLVAQDLRLSHATVKRYVTAMVREGKVEIKPDEFGNALCLSDAERAFMREEADGERRYQAAVGKREERATASVAVRKPNDPLRR